MANETTPIWITYNGEVYNHRALRAELEAKGHVYRSETDTERSSSLRGGRSTLCGAPHGMFALAIWDSRRRELFLARDRLGIKPLYYAQPPGGFIFGFGDQVPLEHPAIVADLDEEAFYALSHLLVYARSADDVPGDPEAGSGQRMTLSADGRVQIESYWNPFSTRWRGDRRHVGARDEDRLIALLRESIAKRMMSDVPFGVFLSGGVDSSTNVALMSELMEDPVRTFFGRLPDHERTTSSTTHARSPAFRHRSPRGGDRCRRHWRPSFPT